MCSSRWSSASWLRMQSGCQPRSGLRSIPSTSPPKKPAPYSFRSSFAHACQEGRALPFEHPNHMRQSTPRQNRNQRMHVVGHGGTLSEPPLLAVPQACGTPPPSAVACPRTALSCGRWGQGTQVVPLPSSIAWVSDLLIRELAYSCFGDSALGVSTTGSRLSQTSTPSPGKDDVARPR